MSEVLEAVRPQGEQQALHQQVGALCYRITAKGRVKVLLVTSRRTRRWIIPKGWPMEGKSAAQAAGVEAWEEAGRFTYDKVREAAPNLRCRVDVFALKVHKLADSFPEREDRLRVWMSLSRAAKQVAEPELAALLRSFSPKGL